MLSALSLLLAAEVTAQARVVTAPALLAAPPSSNDTSFVQVASGEYQNLALRSDGTVIGWGRNDFGQIVPPSDVGEVVQLAAGFRHSIALRSDSTFVEWGGSLDYLPPANIYDDVAQVAAGAWHTAALRSDGTVVAWGPDYSGIDFGQGDVPDELDEVVQVDAAGLFTAALLSDGTVTGWGDNSEGQLSVPAQLDGVAQIAAGWYHVVALRSDGTVVAWGADNEQDYGQADVPEGLDDVVQVAAGGRHTAALRSDGTIVLWGDNSDGQTTVPAGLSDVVQIDAGFYHTLALRSNGTLVAWGRNDDGQSTVLRPSFVQAAVFAEADEFDGGFNGVGHCLALQDDGTVVAWGRSSFFGESPLSVPEGLDDVVQIATHVWTSTALRADGTVVSWGRWDDIPQGLDDVVQITTGGNRTVALRSDGTVVAWRNFNNGDTEVTSGLGDVVQVAAGAGHTVALRSDGTIVAWGENHFGQADVPDGLNEVAQIAAGFTHNVALRRDGTVVAWGDNREGQANVPFGLDGVVHVAAGREHSIAVRSDGTVVAWGGDTAGQTSGISAFEDVVGVASGDYGVVALQLASTSPALLLSVSPEEQEVGIGEDATFEVHVQDPSGLPVPDVQLNVVVSQAESIIFQELREGFNGGAYSFAVPETATPDEALSVAFEAEKDGYPYSLSAAATVLVSNGAPTASSITEPEDGAALTLSGDPQTPLTVVWTVATDTEGDAITYRWEATLTEGDFSEPAFMAETDATTHEVTYAALDAALEAAGVAAGASAPLYHRVVSSDGALETEGPVAMVTLTRGALVSNEEGSVPVAFAHLGGYPNPSSGSLRIAVDLPWAAEITVEVYDAIGRRVAIREERLAAGRRQSVLLDNLRLSPGVYLYRLSAFSQAGSEGATGQFTIVK